MFLDFRRSLILGRNLLGMNNRSGEENKDFIELKRKNRK